MASCMLLILCAMVCCTSSSLCMKVFSSLPTSVFLACSSFSFCFSSCFCCCCSCLCASLSCILVLLSSLLNSAAAAIKEVGENSAAGTGAAGGTLAALGAARAALGAAGAALGAAGAALGAAGAAAAEVGLSFLATTVGLVRSLCGKRGERRATVSDSERQRATASDRKRQRATASNHKRQRATVSDSERQRATASDRKRQRATASNRKRQRATVSDGERPQATASNREQPQNKPAKRATAKPRGHGKRWARREITNRNPSGAHLLHGGVGSVEVGDLLDINSHCALRRGVAVAAGSCQVSQYAVVEASKILMRAQLGHERRYRGRLPPCAPVGISGKPSGNRGLQC